MKILLALDVDGVFNDCDFVERFRAKLEPGYLISREQPISSNSTNTLLKFLEDTTHEITVLGVSSWFGGKFCLADEFGIVTGIVIDKVASSTCGGFGRVDAIIEELDEHQYDCLIIIDDQVSDYHKITFKPYIRLHPIECLNSTHISYIQDELAKVV